jgi:hypothetical protein
MNPQPFEFEFHQVKKLPVKPLDQRDYFKVMIGHVPAHS